MSSKGECKGECLNLAKIVMFLLASLSVDHYVKRALPLRFHGGTCSVLGQNIYDSIASSSIAPEENFAHFV